TQAEVAPPPEPRRTVGEIVAGSGAPGPAEPTVAPSAAPATRPALSTPTPSRTGPEDGIVQRLEREAVGGGLKLKALGAAKTIQGDRSVLAVYVRVENDGAQVIRVDPATFKLVDRAGNRYPVTRGAD